MGPRVDLPNLLENDPLGFWPRLRQTGERFLGLDYDGTLAPFRVERMEAIPAPGASEAVARLAKTGGTRLAIVSGRLVEEVRQLLGELPVLMVGSHGYERLHPDGRLERIPLTAGQQQRIEHAEDQAAELGLADRLERKSASLAFHTRGLDTSEARALEARVTDRWSAGAEDVGLSCRPFDGGVELSAMDTDKGKVLEGLLAEHPVAFAVYVGDDRTDEDAFRVLRATGGVGIKVGVHEIAHTAATAWLPDCTAVVEFLRRWKATTA